MFPSTLFAEATMPFQQVISTLSDSGEEVMGPEVLLYRYPSASVTNGALLTVESNHFAVLKSRGAILNVFETGQYNVSTPEHPLFGSVQKAWFGGQSPWQYEVLYVNRAKLVCRTQGQALSREMAELTYNVDYYVHVDTKDGALALVQHMPYRNHFVTTNDMNAYAAPVIEQAINQVCQVTPLEQINERIHDLTDLVREHLADFLTGYGVMLAAVKVLVRPADEQMRRLIALKAFGLDEVEAARFYTALVMAERGLVSAPNMACGEPFNVGAFAPPGFIGAGVGSPAVRPPASRVDSPSQ